MAGQTLPDWALEMRERDRPIFIAGASARSGTTALHRLMNTHPDVMLHGEEPIVFDMAHICASRIMRFMQERALYDKLRQDALEQRGDMWFDAFLPPADALIQNAFLLFYQAVLPFREDAQRLGKPRWGMKRPNVGVHQVAGLSVLLPRSRTVYLVRDLAEVLRSGKAFYRPRGEYQPAEICRQWAARVVAWAQHSRTAQHFTLNYADLDDRPAWVVEQLAGFLELDGLDPAALARKVNARTTAASDVYVAPEPLNDEETALVRQTETAMRAELAGTALPATGIG